MTQMQWDEAETPHPTRCWLALCALSVAFNSNGRGKLDTFQNSL